MPALVLAQVAAEAGHEVTLVGAQRGIEAQILPRHPFRFHLLPMEPLYRRTWWRNLRWPAIAVRAWWSAGRVLREEQPAIVIGTGGGGGGAGGGGGGAPGGSARPPRAKHVPPSLTRARRGAPRAA